MADYYAPDFRVSIQGLTLQADVTNAVTELSYDNNLDSADMFTLRLDNREQRFTDSALFEPGKSVEVYMGYVGSLEPMMLGEITAVTPTLPQSGPSTLTITGYDKSHRMRHNSPGRFTFKYMNDSVIASMIAGENLLIPIVDPAPTGVRESVQQIGSDWAFLSELANRNYFEVFVHWDKLYFRFPRPQTERVRLEWGRNLSSFNPRLSTADQAGAQELRGYDYKLAQSIVAIVPMISLGTDLDGLTERLGSAAIQQLTQLGRRVVRDQPVDNMFDAATVAKSVLMQLLQGLCEGSGTCIGMPKLRAGDVVEIAGVGRRFSGVYTLRRVTHTIGDSGYVTQFEVSQKFNSSLLKSLRKKIGDSPAPDRQEPQYGVVVGKVENNVDPDGLGRVQLSFPHLSDINLSQWARVASPMAGSQKGIFFLPDRGDEVLVAFERGLVDKPIVVGNLWNGVARPPIVNPGPNLQRTIKVGPDVQILFDTTPGAELIRIEVGAQNSVEVSRTGVKVKGIGIDLN